MIKRSVWAAKIYESLAELVLEVQRLPKVAEKNVDVSRADPNLSHEKWELIYKRMKSNLGNYEHYRKIFDARPSNDEPPISGSIADDLADIYRDLQDGLRRLESDPDHPATAIGDWRMSFAIHWGKHAVHAIAALHDFLFH